MHRVKVGLGERSYSIWIGSGLLKQVGSACSRFGLNNRCAIITDSNVAELYGEVVRRSLKAAGFDPLLITVPAGERAKNLKTVQTCYDELARHGLERGSFIVALGGGVVGDLAGFVAATYLRGIPFVQVATTLLAQVDSSVGGKVGVNLRSGKNLVGAFHQPRLVICDLDTLKTLSNREFHAGLAEVIKYGIIYDARLFRRLEKQLSRMLMLRLDALAPIIARCCAIKAEVVSEDETEQGVRAILNFGHTIGHALEAITGYDRFLHGEAISIGQVAAAEISTELCGFPRKECDRIEELFLRAGLPTRITLTSNQMVELGRAMKRDKKVRSGEVKFVLARALGDVIVGQKVPARLIEQVLGKARAAQILK